MADSKWDRELAKIDRQLESVSDEALFPTKGAPAPATPAARVANAEKQSVAQLQDAQVEQYDYSYW